MTLGIFLAVLFAALLHASWNALVKSNSDTVVSMAAITLGHAPLAVIALPFVAAPAQESWPIMAVSVVVHVIYQISLILAYRLGDFTQVYPIARGSAPVIITVASLVLLDTALTVSQLTAIGLICTGILCLGLMRQTDGLRNPKAVGAALLTGMLIAGYSLLDGVGARLSGSAIGFIAWLTIFNAIIFTAIVTIFDRRVVFKVFTEGKTTFLIGGSASVIAYVIVVSAMTVAPIAVVSALRETSTIFALGIGVLFLKEGLTPVKIVATMLSLGGVLWLRLG